MKAIIHIGMMKTGSSSVQAWLRSNRVALEDRGVRSNEDAQGGFRRLALKHAAFQVAMDELGACEEVAWMGAMKKVPAMESEIHENYQLLSDQLENMSRLPGFYIHSSEGLYKCNETQIIALDTFLSRFFEHRTYVVYIRNVADLFVSLYSQKLRTNPYFDYVTPERHYARQEYFEFMAKCTSELVPYGRESSFEHLFAWHSMLGSRLNVRLLEPDWLVEGDLIEDFAYLAGVPALRKPARMNESFAAEYVEYVRYLNCEMHDAIPQKFRKEVLSILKSASSGKPKVAVSDALAKSIRYLHREQEEKIRKTFFPDRPFLFSPKHRGEGVAPAPLTDQRRAEIESEIREKMSPEVWASYELARNGG